MIECFGLLEMKLKLNLLFCYFQCRYTYFYWSRF